MSTPTEEPIELPPLALHASGPTAAEQWVNSERVQSSPGYPALVLLLADAFRQWAERIVLDVNSQVVSVRFQLDGLWQDMPGLDRQTGDYMIAVLKQISGLDFRTRDRAQKGKFKAELYFKKYNCEVRCEPVPTGERVQIQVELPRDQPDTLVDMGMRQSSFDQFKAFFGRKSGLIVAATLPGDGASTLWKGVKAAGDRFMSDYVTVEEEGRAEPEVVNVNSVTYPADANFETFLNTVLLKEPDAVFLPHVRDPKLLATGVKLSQQYGRLLIVQIEAHSAADAVYRLQLMGLSPDQLNKILIGVIASRTARRLCDNCKQPYQPDPETLSRLGIPVGRVRQFFAPFDPYQFAETDKNGNTILPPPCEQCQGAGYFGRLGLFELISWNDELARLVSGGRPLAEMQQWLRNQKNRTFREEAIAAIALGQTSIEEVQRILRK